MLALEVKFKRSLMGYHPASVDSLLERTDADFQKRIAVLKDQLADEIRLLEISQNEVAAIKNEIGTFRLSENEICQALLAAHLKTTEKLYAAAREMERMEKDAQDRVVQKKKELAELTIAIEKVREEFQALAARYKLSLENLIGG